AVCLLALMPLQFAWFYVDYFNDYRIRSIFWFERNIRGGLEEIIARDTTWPVPAIYLSRNIPWVDWYWKFYLIKHHHQSEAAAGATLVDPGRLDEEQIPAGSLLLDRKSTRLNFSHEWISYAVF